MARGDALDLEILGSILGRNVSFLRVTNACNKHSLGGSLDERHGQVKSGNVAKGDKAKKEKRMTHACEFEYFGSQILENGSDIDSCLGADAHLVLGVLLEETLDTTAREL